MRGLVAVVLSITFEFVALGMPARATDTLPMNFILRFEASAESCGAKCRLLVVATGTITAETPRQFALFAKAHDVTRATVVLNFEGGSVDGAIALGRALRQFGLDTTVGRVIDLKEEQQNTASAVAESTVAANQSHAAHLRIALFATPNNDRRR